MRDITFISLEGWDDIWRRNQFVCAELARRDPDRRILFVAPPRDLSNALRRANAAGLRATPSWSPDGLPNVTVFTPTKWWPNSLAAGRRLNAAALRRQILAEQGRLGIVAPKLWINDHSAGHLARTLCAAAVVYDVTDDWISFYPPSKVRELVRRQDERLCQDADEVIVCSQRLYDLKSSTVAAGRLSLIPNGVDADHYAGVADPSAPVAEPARAWPKPVFGYTGTIHPDRVDVTLVESFASRLDQGCVALVGPSHLSAADTARLTSTGRVFMTGPARYADLPGYMRAFDVCIVPHRMTAFTESLNPIKLWEYLAAGKPIVSMDVAGFREFPRLVELARDADSFSSAARQALGEPRERGEMRRAEARAHSWAARVDEVERVLARARATAGRN